MVKRLKEKPAVEMRENGALCKQAHPSGERETLLVHVCWRMRPLGKGGDLRRSARDESKTLLCATLNSLLTSVRLVC